MNSATNDKRVSIMNMHKSSFAIGILWCPMWSLTILVLLFVLLLPGSVVAKSVGIDPQAEKQLKATLDYLSGLKQFSVETHNTIEGVLDYGQKVQFDFHASITLQRPGKLLAERHGDIVDQAWYYDGTTLTLHDTASNYYARVQAPGNINEMLDLAPKISESTFSFVPPKGAQATDFLLLDLSGIYIHQGQPE